MLVIFLSWGYERHTHFHAFDVMLHGRADSVLGAVQDAEDAADNVMLDHARPARARRRHLRGVGRARPDAGPLAQLAGQRRSPSTPEHDGFSRIVVNQRHYRVLREHGSRIVDPGEPGGGKLRQVTVLYGAPTEHVWHAIRGAVEFYAAGSLLLLRGHRPADRVAAASRTAAAAPVGRAGLAGLGGRMGVSTRRPVPAPRRELAPLTHAIESVLQRLERAFVQQRTFVSDAAHELKTAVAVVKSSLQLLGLRPRTAAEYQAGLERCLADTARLEELVAKMLTLARVESGASRRRTAAPACDMAACLQQTVAQLETVAALRRVRVTVEGPPVGACQVPLDGRGLLAAGLKPAAERAPAQPARVGG